MAQILCDGYIKKKLCTSQSAWSLQQRLGEGRGPRLKTFPDECPATRVKSLRIFLSRIKSSTNHTMSFMQCRFLQWYPSLCCPSNTFVKRQTDFFVTNVYWLVPTFPMETATRWNHKAQILWPTGRPYIHFPAQNICVFEIFHMHFKHIFQFQLLVCQLFCVHLSLILLALRIIV